ncbi:MAG: hypothetical protein EBZ48_09350 [Proteobacteria bacterium]|nr:hypothetical protein [Pseudomonadota bacterium]
MQQLAKSTNACYNNCKFFHRPNPMRSLQESETDQSLTPVAPRVLRLGLVRSKGRITVQKILLSAALSLGSLAGTGALSPVWSENPATLTIDVSEYVRGLPADYLPEGFTAIARSLLARDGAKALEQLQRLKTASSRATRADRISYLEALAFAQRGDMTEALRSVEQSLALKGSNSDALYLYSELLTNPESKLDALSQATWFGRFAAITPAQALSKQAALLIQKGQVRQGEATLQRALSLNSECIECRLGLAELSLQSGKKSEAVSALRQALALAPQNTTLKRALARTLLSGAQRGNDNALIEEARQLSEAVYSSEAVSRSDTAAIYAQALIDGGDTVRATQVVRGALNAYPGDPTLSRLAQQITVETQARNPQGATDAVGASILEPK